MRGFHLHILNLWWDITVCCINLRYIHYISMAHCVCLFVWGRMWREECEIERETPPFLLVLNTSYDPKPFCLWGLFYFYLLYLFIYFAFFLLFFSFFLFVYTTTTVIHYLDKDNLIDLSQFFLCIFKVSSKKR